MSGSGGPLARNRRTRYWKPLTSRNNPKRNGGEGQGKKREQVPDNQKNGGNFMEKYIYDESNGLWYERQGDYYLPCLSLPEEEERPIGLWGQRHLRYIREYRKALYTSLQLSGKLNGYLADIDQQAQERLDTIIRQMAEAQGITEALKAADPMAWVGQMNYIQSVATEIVNAEVIFT